MVYTSNRHHDMKQIFGCSEQLYPCQCSVVSFIARVEARSITRFRFNTYLRTVDVGVSIQVITDTTEQCASLLV